MQEVLLWTDGDNYSLGGQRKSKLSGWGLERALQRDLACRLAEHESLRFQVKNMKPCMYVGMCGWGGVCTIGAIQPSFSSFPLVYQMAQGSNLSYNVPFLGKLWCWFSVDGLLGGPSWGCPGEKSRPWGR